MKRVLVHVTVMNPTITRSFSLSWTLITILLGHQSSRSEVPFNTSKDYGRHFTVPESHQLLSVHALEQDTQNIELYVKYITHLRNLNQCSRQDPHQTLGSSSLLSPLVKFCDVLLRDFTTTYRIKGGHIINVTVKDGIDVLHL